MNERVVIRIRDVVQDAEDMAFLDVAMIACQQGLLAAGNPWANPSHMAGDAITLATALAGKRRELFEKSPTEGWAIFQSDLRGWEIQKDDEAGRFLSDSDALEFVVNTPSAARACIEELLMMLNESDKLAEENGAFRT